MTDQIIEGVETSERCVFRGKPPVIPIESIH